MTIESGPYWKIDKSDFRSKLPGEFYANSGGIVYYVDTKSGSLGSVEDNVGNQDGGGTTPAPEPTEAPTPEPTIAPGETNNTESTGQGPNGEEVPPGYTLLTDADFEFIEFRFASNSYSISSINEGASTKGYFHYKGKDDKVVIPHVIMGNDIKDYFQMFYYNGDSSIKVNGAAEGNGTAVIAVASNNPNVTIMSSMFFRSQATSLDLSSFNTSKVTNMSSMFNSSQATLLDLSNFDTSNVTDMQGMFSNSQATTIVGLDKFNTSKVNYMSQMFWQSRAKSLDLSNFDTSNVTTMSQMFYESKATTGWARTQADANKFNASSDKPAGLTFNVKQ